MQVGFHWRGPSSLTPIDTGVRLLIRTRATAGPAAILKSAAGERPGEAGVSGSGGGHQVPRPEPRRPVEGTCGVHFLGATARGDCQHRLWIPVQTILTAGPSREKPESGIGKRDPAGSSQAGRGRFPPCPQTDFGHGWKQYPIHTWYQAIPARRRCAGPGRSWGIGTLFRHPGKFYQGDVRGSED